VGRIPAVTLYVAGLVFAEALRLPRRIDRLRSRRLRQTGGAPRDWLDGVVMAAVILGVWLLPLIYVFTPWLRPFDYSLPVWAVWAGAGIFAISLSIRLSAQRTLGRQWSATVETPEAHKLVTTGIYSRIRHPIYASLVLWAAAQPALLQNLVAGWGGAVAVALIWLLRVPNEERVMLEEFGSEYRVYMARTGRLIPRRRQPSSLT